MVTALSVLAHNGQLIRQAERTLQKMAENENCYLYLINPDGTRIRIMAGCRIEDYEMHAITKD